MNNKIVQIITVQNIGGSEGVNVESPVDIVHIKTSGLVTLSSAINIVTSGTPAKNTYIKFIYNGNIVSNNSTGKSVFIFGTELTDLQALIEGEITAFYDGSWTVRVFPDSETGTTIVEDGSITNPKLSSLNRGYIKVGDSSNFVSDINAKEDARILIGDGVDLKSVDVTGDVTINNSGVTTIGVGKVTSEMLSDDASYYDSGWKTLSDYDAAKGFGLPPFTSGSHPKIRIINRTVYLFGNLILPLMDAGNVFIPDSDNYGITSNSFCKLYTGADYGYSFVGSRLAQSRKPIIPANLTPDDNTFISEVSIYNRLIKGGTTSSNISMPTILTNVVIHSDGVFRVSSHRAIDEFPNASLTTKSGMLHSIVTKATLGDFVLEYGAYKTSFTGATDNRIVTASTDTFPLTIDTNDVTDLGGYPINLNTSWLVNETITTQEIKDAFNTI